MIISHIHIPCVPPFAIAAVLVDEASMLDVQLAAALTRALPDGCQLLLVGDPHQLPPVGPGAVLQDLIDSGIVPRVRDLALTSTLSLHQYQGASRCGDIWPTC
jgi:ATP-dependent exoDNAse (exonuclease V) alpha subunit